MSLIRVLHIIGKMDRAGAETMLMNLYRHIDRTKIQFDFVTFTKEKGDYDDEIIALGGKIIPLTASGSISRMFELYHFLKNNPEYQIIHAHVLLNNAFHLLAAKNAGVKYRISHSHNTSNGKKSGIAKLYEKWAIGINKKLSTHKIACGREAAEYLFGTTENVWLLKNAIDLQSYRVIADENKNYWKSIKNDIQGLKIIQVGRLNEVKNHDFSLEIARKLKEQGVNFNFFIVGQGPLENSIRQTIQDSALDENVYLLGVRDDVPSLMAGADVMLMPSLHEGFPVVLVESQAIGLKAIISTNISEEVDLGVNLVDFLPIGNEGSLGIWVDKIIEEKSVEFMGEDYLNILCMQNFDIFGNSKKIQDLYINMV